MNYSHSKIELQRPNGAKKSVQMFPFTYSNKTRNNNRVWLTEGSWFFAKKPVLSIRESEPSV